MRKNTCFFLIAVIIIITLIFSTMSYFDRTLKKDTSELIIEIDNIISENKNNQKNFEKSKNGSIRLKSSQLYFAKSGIAIDIK